MQLADFENLGHLASFVVEGLAQLCRLCTCMCTRSSPAAGHVHSAAGSPFEFSECRTVIQEKTPEYSIFFCSHGFTLHYWCTGVQVGCSAGSGGGGAALAWAAWGRGAAQRRHRMRPAARLRQPAGTAVHWPRRCAAAGSWGFRPMHACGCAHPPVPLPHLGYSARAAAHSRSWHPALHGMGSLLSHLCRCHRAARHLSYAYCRQAVAMSWL